MPDRERLYEFERIADEQVDQLELWQLPLRSLLSSLFLTADSLFVGHRFSRDVEPKPHHGAAVLSRLSYIADKFNQLDLQIGANLNDALSVIRPEHQQQFKDLLGYAHLCELVPEVRRNRYSVIAEDAGFRFDMASDDVRFGEELDVLFTEMCLAYPKEPTNVDPEEIDQTAGPRNSDIARAVSILRALHSHYLEVMVETPLLPGDKYQESYGFQLSDFKNVRSYLLAFADFCAAMADVYEARAAIARNENERRRAAEECLEWAVPLLKSNFVLGAAQAITSLDARTIDRVVDFFVMNPAQGNFEKAGDGYLPPLVRFEESFLFSPFAIQAMLPERNLLYVSNRVSRDHFANVISSSLEQVLLDELVRAFRLIQQWHAVPNVNWERGEIDLLVFDTAENSALNLQAKAAIPPQGARMTRQVETRAIEGVQQIRTFAELIPEQKDAVCGGAVGFDVHDVTWHSALASRSGFGTSNLWDQLGEIVPFNPPILRGAIRRMADQDACSLSDLMGTVRQIIDEIQGACVTGWHHEEFSLFGTTLTVPLLDLDHTAIDRYRADYSE